MPDIRVKRSDPTQLLRPRQVAAALSVTVATLADWRHRGVGPPFVRLSPRSVRYSRDGLDRWLDDRASSRVEVAALSETAWAARSGRQVSRGRLIAASDTDYLVFACAACGTPLEGGAGIGLEGVRVDDETGAIEALAFRQVCDECGFRDFFRIPVDESGRYQTEKIGDVNDWCRDGTQPPHRGLLCDLVDGLEDFADRVARYGGASG